jgi:hypothetical protein
MGVISMKKIRIYKGWVIAANKEGWHVFSKDEYSMGEGFRYPEFECSSEEECISNIDSY